MKTAWPAEVTAKDVKATAAVARFAMEHHYAPSTRDLMEATGVTSTATVHERLKRLQAHGLITRIPNTHRSIRLTAKGVELVCGRCPR